MQQKEFQQTLVLIKPDALKNSLTGYVLSILSEVHTGLRFAACKIVHVNQMLAEEHYAEHKGKLFFPPLIDYIMGRLHYPDAAWKRRVIALVYQGPGAVKIIRDFAGPTNPLAAREKCPGCIRSLGATIAMKDGQGKVIGERMENLIHASASDAEAEREIKLWFKPNDIPPLMQPYPVLECDEHFYYRDGALFTTHESGTICLLAPGDIAWGSDLEALRLIVQNKTAALSLSSVVAKYMINQKGVE
jgi:nucleoside-diphosphate kinase